MGRAARATEERVSSERTSEVVVVVAASRRIVSAPSWGCGQMFGGGVAVDVVELLGYQVRVWDCKAQLAP